MNNNSTKVLIIDDDRVMCETLKDILLESGYRAEYCNTHKEIAHCVVNSQYDVVLLDLTFRGIDENALCKTIHKKSPHTIIFFMSTHSNESELLTYMRLGVHGILKKPFDLDDLIECINHRNTPVLLVVADNKDFCLECKCFLQKEGFYILTAANNDGARDAIFHMRPTVVVLDMDIPDETGDEIFGTIQQNIPRVKIICCACSRATLSQKVARTIAKKGCAYLDKPVKLPELCALVRELTALV